MRGRRSRGESYWRQMIEKQEQSGTSVVEFCRSENLAMSTFQKWKRQLRSQTSAFAEVRVAESEVARDGDIRIRLACGTVVRCSGSLNVEQLESALRAVRASSC